MKDHPLTLFVYRCAAGHTLYRRFQEVPGCSRCDGQSLPTDAYDAVIDALAFCAMIDWADTTRKALGMPRVFRKGKPMKYIGHVDREEDETEINHELRALMLKEQTVH
jgi:hypothetical protein